MGKVREQTLIVMTAAAAVTIIMLISTLAMVLPQTAYAQQDERNPSSLSSDVDNCASDELPTRIDGTIRCMKQGECYSSEFQFDGKKAKHCNFMMSSNDE
jgi:hypothetical protein